MDQISQSASITFDMQFETILSTYETYDEQIDASSMRSNGQQYFYGQSQISTEEAFLKTDLPVSTADENSLESLDFPQSLTSAGNVINQPVGSMIDADDYPITSFIEYLMPTSSNSFVVASRTSAEIMPTRYNNNEKTTSSIIDTQESIGYSLSQVSSEVPRPHFAENDNLPLSTTANGEFDGYNRWYGDPITQNDGYGHEQYRTSEFEGIISLAMSATSAKTFMSFQESGLEDKTIFTAVVTETVAIGESEPSMILWFTSDSDDEMISKLSFGVTSIVPTRRPESTILANKLTTEDKAQPLSALDSTGIASKTFGLNAFSERILETAGATLHGEVYPETILSSSATGTATRSVVYPSEYYWWTAPEQASEPEFAHTILQTETNIPSFLRETSTLDYISLHLGGTEPFSSAETTDFSSETVVDFGFFNGYPQSPDTSIAVEIRLSPYTSETATHDAIKPSQYYRWTDFELEPTSYSEYSFTDFPIANSEITSVTFSHLALPTPSSNSDDAIRYSGLGESESLETLDDASSIFTTDVATATIFSSDSEDFAQKASEFKIGYTRTVVSSGYTSQTVKNEPTTALLYYSNEMNEIPTFASESMPTPISANSLQFSDAVHIEATTLRVAETTYLKYSMDSATTTVPITEAIGLKYSIDSAATAAPRTEMPELKYSIESKVMMAQFQYSISSEELQSLSSISSGLSQFSNLYKENEFVTFYEASKTTVEVYPTLLSSNDFEHFTKSESHKCSDSGSLLVAMSQSISSDERNPEESSTILTESVLKSNADQIETTYPPVESNFLSYSNAFPYIPSSDLYATTAIPEGNTDEATASETFIKHSKLASVSKYYSNAYDIMKLTTSEIPEFIRTVDPDLSYSETGSAQSIPSAIYSSNVNPTPLPTNNLEILPTPSYYLRNDMPSSTYDSASETLETIQRLDSVTRTPFIVVASSESTATARSSNVILTERTSGALEYIILEGSSSAPVPPTDPTHHVSNVLLFFSTITAVDRIEYILPKQTSGQNQASQTFWKPYITNSMVTEMPESTISSAIGIVKTTFYSANGESTLYSANGESTLSSANGDSTLFYANGGTALPNSQCDLSTELAYRSMSTRRLIYSVHPLEPATTQTDGSIQVIRASSSKPDASIWYPANRDYTIVSDSQRFSDPGMEYTGALTSFVGGSETIASKTVSSFSGSEKAHSFSNEILGLKATSSADIKSTLYYSATPLPVSTLVTNEDTVSSEATVSVLLSNGARAKSTTYALAKEAQLVESYTMTTQSFQDSSLRDWEQETVSMSDNRFDTLTRLDTFGMTSLAVPSVYSLSSNPLLPKSDSASLHWTTVAGTTQPTSYIRSPETTSTSAWQTGFSRLPFAYYPTAGWETVESTLADAFSVSSTIALGSNGAAAMTLTSKSSETNHLYSTKPTYSSQTNQGSNQYQSSSFPPKSSFGFTLKTNDFETSTLSVLLEFTDSWSLASHSTSLIADTSHFDPLTTSYQSFSRLLEETSTTTSLLPPAPGERLKLSPSAAVVQTSTFSQAQTESDLEIQSTTQPEIVTTTISALPLGLISSFPNVFSLSTSFESTVSSTRYSTSTLSALPTVSDLIEPLKSVPTRTVNSRTESSATQSIISSSESSAFASTVFPSASSVKTSTTPSASALPMPPFTIMPILSTTPSFVVTSVATTAFSTSMIATKTTSATLHKTTSILTLKNLNFTSTLILPPPTYNVSTGTSTLTSFLPLPALNVWINSTTTSLLASGTLLPFTSSEIPTKTFVADISAATSSTKQKLSPTSTLTSASSCKFPGQILSCGSCVFADQRDCRGLCPSRTSMATFIKDCAGRCVASNDAKVLDVCGVCGGDGTSCLDCLGIPFGNATVDACNVCNGSGTTCGLVVNTLEPIAIPNTGKSFFDIVGAGLMPGETRLEINGTSLLSSDIRTINGFQRLRVFVRSKFQLPANAGTVVTVRVSVPGAPTVAVELGVYEPFSTIQDVSTDRMYIDTAGALQFSGSNFYTEYNGTSSCIFATKPQLTYVKLNIISSALAFCDVPMSSFSTMLDYIVVYGILPDSKTVGWRDDLGITFHDQKNISLTYFAPAPTMVSAKFSNDGTSMSVDFSFRVDTNPSSSLQDYMLCDNFFVTDGSTPDSAALVRPGMLSDCKIRFEDRISAILTLDPRVVSGFMNYGSRSITLKESVLRAYKEEFSDYANGTVKVSPSDIPPKPKVVIQGPDFVPKCASIRMDLSRSSTGGGDTFSAAEFDLSPIASSTAMPDIGSVVKEQQSSFLVSRNEFSIPAQNLAPTNYNFTASLSNIFGGVDVAAKAFRVLNSTSFPSVTVLFPPSKIKASEPIQLIAQIDATTGCAPSDPPSMTWYYLNGTNGFEFAINPQYANLFSLTIPPMTLPPQSTFFFELLIATTDGFLGSSTVLVSTAEEIITVNTGGNVTLPASKAKLWATFTDDSISTLDASSFTFQWFCFADSKECDFGDGISLPQTQNLDFSGLLLPGSYSFYLKVINRLTGTSGLSQPVFVNLVSKIIPVFDIKVTGTQLSILSDGAILTASIEPTSVNRMSSVTFAWAFATTCGGDPDKYQILNLSNGTLKTGNPDFKIPAAMISPAASYCMSLTITDPISKVAATNYKMFTVGDVPRGGYCYVVSSTFGIEFSTQFQFRCTGWVSSSPPESFLWEVKNTASSKWRLLAGPNSIPTLSAAFAKGSYKIRATVLDRFGVRNQVEQIMSINVVASPKSVRRDAHYAPRRNIVVVKRRQVNATVSSSVPISHLQDVVIPAFNNFKDVNAAMTAISVLTATLYDDSYSVMAKADLGVNLLAFLDTLLTSGMLYITETLHGPALISNLFGIVNSTTMNSSSIFSTVQYERATLELQTVVKAIMINIRGTGNCISEENISTLLSTLSLIMKSVSEYRASIGTTLLTLLHSVKSCYFASLSCGDESKRFMNVEFNIQFGFERATDSSKQVCNVSFNTTALQPYEDDRGCFRYLCGDYANIVLAHNDSASPYISTNPAGQLIDIVDRNGDSVIWPNSTDFNIIVTLEFSTELATSISALSDVERMSQVACSIVRSVQDESGITLSQWDVSGCILKGLNATSATCGCMRPGSIAVGIIPPLPQTISAPTQTTTLPNDDEALPPASKPNLGAILGGVFGSVTAVFLGIAGFGIYQSKMKNKLKKVEPERENEEDGDEEEDTSISILYLPPLEEEKDDSEESAVPSSLSRMETNSVLQLRSETRNAFMPRKETRKIYPEGYVQGNSFSRASDPRKVYPEVQIYPSPSPAHAASFNVSPESLLNGVQAGKIPQAPGSEVIDVVPKIPEVLQPEVPWSAYPLDEPVDPQAFSNLSAQVTSAAQLLQMQPQTTPGQPWQSQTNPGFDPRSGGFQQMVVPTWQDQDQDQLVSRQYEQHPFAPVDAPTLAYPQDFAVGQWPQNGADSNVDNGYSAGNNSTYPSSNQPYSDQNK
ncbi:hypothetical protein HDU97_003017 [Phlyctochytrium planicorne]|nr:hypothetical protein HDU97_003017 [Phlyctochytrium planicorne]